MYFKRQKFLVAGMSKSGESCARFLLDRGARVYMYDDVSTDGVLAVMNKFKSEGAEIVTAESYARAVEECDILVLSPGIPIDNPLPVAFRRQGKAILGEEELGAMFLRACAVAVTGTNGKTTTVSMIAHVLNAAGINAKECGNIGSPLVGEVESLGFDDCAVIEISSFQLETLSLLRPHVAVVTNITEDHLNRHYNMENYVFLKSKLVRGLRESEYAVLNYDDERVRGFSSLTKAKTIYFSAKRKIEGGAYLDGGAIYFSGEKYAEVEELPVQGMHNVYNVLACAAACAIMGVDGESFSKHIQTFKGIRHRTEFIRRVNGVDYINDSKATNADATLKAVESLTQSAVLLLGGKDKGYDYEPLFTALKNSRVVHAVIYGENRFKLMGAAVNVDFEAFSLCREFDIAVRLASLIAKEGQCVLLSPASASFDGFANYEERGERFARIVEGLDEQDEE